ncbi:MAG: alpha/beta hydrolase [Marmoricola sp.]
MHDRLTMTELPTDVHALVVMLHGGAEHGQRPVDHRSLALRRTRAMFRSISPRLTDAGIGVALLRFAVKGWNAGGGRVPSPVTDARLAVQDLHAEHPDLPIVLLGHSMGARTAAWVADEPGVVGVVGLAPWVPADEPVGALAGKHLVAAHGSRDRITSAKASRVFVSRAAEVAEEARFVDMGARGHYMMAGATAWNQVATTESLGILERVSQDR